MFDCEEGTNETLCFTPYSKRTETYVVPILFSFIFLVGILGNGALIYIFVKNKSMRNVRNMYILSLAVGDLLVTLFCIPFTTAIYIFESWPFGEFVCKLSEFMKDFSTGVSVYTLTAYSADRYFAISYPMRNLPLNQATGKTFSVIVGVWILSIIMASPSALFPYVRLIEDSPEKLFEVCFPYPLEFGESYAKGMVLLRLFGYYLVPLGFTATYYTLMSKQLMRSSESIPSVGPALSPHIQTRKKVAKTVLLLVGVFALCFLPQQIHNVWFFFNPASIFEYSFFWYYFRIFGFCCSFLNSCINPVALYCYSGQFHKKFNSTLFCWCCDNVEDEVPVPENINVIQHHVENVEEVVADDPV